MYSEAVWNIVQWTSGLELLTKALRKLGEIAAEDPGALAKVDPSLIIELIRRRTVVAANLRVGAAVAPVDTTSTTEGDRDDVTAAWLVAARAKRLDEYLATASFQAEPLRQRARLLIRVFSVIDLISARPEDRDQEWVDSLWARNASGIARASLPTLAALGQALGEALRQPSKDALLRDRGFRALVKQFTSTRDAWDGIDPYRCAMTYALVLGSIVERLGEDDEVDDTLRNRLEPRDRPARARPTWNGSTSWSRPGPKPRPSSPPC